MRTAREVTWQERRRHEELLRRQQKLYDEELNREELRWQQWRRREDVNRAHEFRRQEIQNHEDLNRALELSQQEMRNDEDLNRALALSREETRNHKERNRAHDPSRQGTWSHEDSNRALELSPQERWNHEDLNRAVELSREEIRNHGHLYRAHELSRREEIRKHEEPNRVRQSAIPNLGATREELVTLAEEFRYNAAFQEKVRLLQAEGYVAWRRIRGDGNCFYRAFGVHLLERALRLPPGSEERRRSVGRVLEQISRLRDNLDKQQVTARENLLARLKRLGEGLPWDGSSSPLAPSRASSSWGPSEMREEVDAVVRSLLDPAGSVDEALILGLRRLAAAHLMEKKEDLVDGPSEGISYDIIARSEGYEGGVEEFCSKVVLPMGKEAEGVVLHALPRALGVELHLVFLDRLQGPQAGVLPPLVVFGGGGSKLGGSASEPEGALPEEEAEVEGAEEQEEETEEPEDAEEAPKRAAAEGAVRPARPDDAPWPPALRVSLQLRPGHYDILYSAEDSLCEAPRGGEEENLGIASQKASAAETRDFTRTPLPALALQDRVSKDDASVSPVGRSCPGTAAMLGADQEGSPDGQQPGHGLPILLGTTNTTTGSESRPQGPEKHFMYRMIRKLSGRAPSSGRRNPFGEARSSISSKLWGTKEDRRGLLPPSPTEDEKPAATGGGGGGLVNPADQEQHFATSQKMECHHQDRNHGNQNSSQSEGSDSSRDQKSAASEADDQDDVQMNGQADLNGEALDLAGLRESQGSMTRKPHSTSRHYEDPTTPEPTWRSGAYFEDPATGPSWRIPRSEQALRPGRSTQQRPAPIRSTSGQYDYPATPAPTFNEASIDHRKPASLSNPECDGPRTLALPF